MKVISEVWKTPCWKNDSSCKPGWLCCPGGNLQPLHSQHHNHLWGEGIRTTLLFKILLTELDHMLILFLPQHISYPLYLYWLILTDILKVTALTEEDMRERVEVRLHVLRDHNIKSERYRGLWWLIPSKNTNNTTMWTSRKVFWWYVYIQGGWISLPMVGFRTWRKGGPSKNCL